MDVTRDREMERLVTGALKRDSRVDLGEITVRVESGIAYLTGMVDSAAERVAAQQNVEATLGPGKMVDQLTLRNFVERTDQELEAEVKQALHRDLAVDAGPITVKADSGVVSLSGRVLSYAQCYAAENVAWWTPGVTEVRSHLVVDGFSGEPE